MEWEKQHAIELVSASWNEVIPFVDEPLEAARELIHRLVANGSYEGLGSILSDWKTQVSRETAEQEEYYQDTPPSLTLTAEMVRLSMLIEQATEHQIKLEEQEKFSEACVIARRLYEYNIAFCRLVYEEMLQPWVSDKEKDAWRELMSSRALDLSILILKLEDYAKSAGF